MILLVLEVEREFGEGEEEDKVCLCDQQHYTNQTNLPTAVFCPTAAAIATNFVSKPLSKRQRLSFSLFFLSFSCFLPSSFLLSFLPSLLPSLIHLFLCSLISFFFFFFLFVSIIRFRFLIPIRQEA